jgi:hypothetical protein
MTFLYHGNVTQNCFEINNIYRSKNGGFITYLFLYFKLWKMLLCDSQVFGFWHKIWISIVILCKTPYFLIIKPLGYFFSSKTTLKGEYILTNGELSSTEVKKTYCMKFLFIPIFYYSGKPNNEDWKKLLNS